MTEARTALARLFVLLACVTLPREQVSSFAVLLGVNEALKAEREKQRAP